MAQPVQVCQVETQEATDSFIYTFRSITGKFKLFYVVLHTVYCTNVSSSVVFLFYFVLCIDLISSQVDKILAIKWTEEFHFSVLLITAHQAVDVRKSLWIIETS